MAQVEGTIQIQAARKAVWQRFADIAQWSEWNREVIHARWISGTPWEEGSTFTVEHYTLFGLKTATTYVVRMCVEERSAVYESARSIPVAMTSSVQLSDSLGGTRLEATHHYAGPLAGLVGVLRSRQQTVLGTAMQALKEIIEGPRRR